MTTLMTHQYVERGTCRVVTEKIYADRLINLLYTRSNESAGHMLRLLTSAWMTEAIGFLVYDAFPTGQGRQVLRTARRMGVDVSECLEPDLAVSSMRRLFQRKIRYWECRPMPPEEGGVVSPADARVIVGQTGSAFGLSIKDKFFEQDELIGDRREWQTAFRDGDYAIFRLTPDKYHYNHAPVSGLVRDIYMIDGAFSSCNPGAVVKLAASHSKNRRVVTIIDTDVADGSRVGLVAMVEIVAMMIGRIDQCYSAEKYDHPVEVRPGLFLRRGQPKSLYRPGSSTDVLLFEKGRIAFCDDLVRNRDRTDVASRFSVGFGRPLVETEVLVRSPVAFARDGLSPGDSLRDMKMERNNLQ